MEAKSEPRANIMMVRSFCFTRRHLPSKAAVFSFSGKVSRHHLLGEELAVANDERLAMRKPRNRVAVTLFVENLHEALRKDLRVVFVFHCCGR